MTVKLDIDHAPLLLKLWNVLQQEPSVVRQQQAIELLAVKHALRMGNEESALHVADGIHKHVTQLIKQRKSHIQ